MYMYMCEIKVAVRQKEKESEEGPKFKKVNALEEHFIRSHNFNPWSDTEITMFSDKENAHVGNKKCVGSNLPNVNLSCALVMKRIIGKTPSENIQTESGNQ